MTCEAVLFDINHCASIYTDIHETAALYCLLRFSFRAVMVLFDITLSEAILILRC